ncbi:MAG: sporulation protein YqfD [Ruminococcus sp.]|nr:sporulation protein YqfD [Ruminococcus sp.]
MRIKRYIQINAHGKNIYDFINRIHKENFNCFAQYCRNDVFHAQMYRRDLKRIKALADECSIILDIREFPSAAGRASKYRLRFGIFFGILIISVIIIYFSQVVVTIEIEGNSAVSSDTILSALENMNVRKGTPIRDIDFIKCENKLMFTVDGISWVGMRYTGNRLVVQVTETVEKPEMVNERLPCNVTADKTAQITYTSVYDGMLMKKVGDYVFEGDMLISGVTSDDTGHVTFHHAMGQITGIYKENISFSENLSEKRKVFTGREKTTRKLDLFGFKIPLFSGGNSYESFESEENAEYLEIFGRYLPIGIYETKILETSFTETLLTPEQAESNIMEKIYLYEKNFTSDIEILDRNIKKNTAPECITYDVEYTLKGDICRENEIFIK